MLFFFFFLESSSRIFQEALKEGVLDINMASIMFVGINSPGSTSAKHLVFQEAVPTTYKATLLVNHEIYFKAEGDPTLKKLQPDTCTDVMLMSHCLCKSPVAHECPFPQEVSATPRDLSQVVAAPKEPSQGMTASRRAWYSQVPKEVHSNWQVKDPTEAKSSEYKIKS